MMEVLEIKPDAKGILLKRENRFLARVMIDGKEISAHVHDPGRLEELLFPGNELLLKRAEGEKRKTAWDVIASKFSNFWVLTNSGYHRKISELLLHHLMPDYNLQAEVKMGKSRIDFLASRGEEKIAIEVKGCTLAKDGVALFPDAPTSRGRRHVEELIKFVEGGHKAMLLILVFRPDSLCFSPNYETDPKFSEVFEKAVRARVHILPTLLNYDGRNLIYMGNIPLCR